MEAGVLYEKAQSWDKAAAVYIKIKNWSEITFCYLDFFLLLNVTCMYVCHVHFVYSLRISIEKICYSGMIVIL